jgi:sugar lactone lactonase YvrE
MRSARALAAACAALATLAAAPAADASFGDARVLAPFPASPGFPEGIAVRDGRVYAAGAATFGTTGAGPSSVVAYDRATGAVVRRYDVVGENKLMEHANSSIAFDGAGRLYVLNTQLGIYRLNVATGAQQSYASPFPDLLPCAPVVAPPPCSPTPANTPPIPNDIAFAPNGDAYVTDSLQATIWRIPAGGGAPQIWFQDRRFAGPYIAANGLRLNPAGARVYVSVSIDLLGHASLYSLPLVSKPRADQLRLEYRFPAGQLPDGIAFGQTGRIFVAMATAAASGVLILNQDRTPRARLRNPKLSPFSPYDGPANIAFDGAGHILLTNHAPFTGLALRRFSIVDVDVGDAGAPLFQP